MRGYDYTREGFYYVTICTYKQEHLLGEIKNGKMLLNAYGQIVRDTWNDLPNHIAGIELDAFQIMPNHVHAVISIVPGAMRARGDSEMRADGDSAMRAGLEPARTGDRVGAGSKPALSNAHPAPDAVPAHPLSEIVRQFKTFSARRINEIRNMSGIPVWHRNYFEIIIRNENKLNRVRQYIINNPQKWEKDRNNLKN